MDAPVLMAAPEGRAHYITKVGRYYETRPDGTVPVDAHDVEELRQQGYRTGQSTPPATLPLGEQIAPGYVPMDAPLLPEPEPQPERAVEPAPEPEPPAEPTV